MKNKVFTQGLLLVICFLGMWFLLSKIDFVSLFKIKQRTDRIESKIGDLIWDEVAHNENVMINDSITKTLHKLIKPICEANNINFDSLKIHIVKKEDINAFALPNNHLVVYTGLILDCKKQEALQGVLSHEIAHIEKNHVMKKLSKEIGLTVILEATTGEKGGQILKEIFKMLSSTAYDRSLEKEADLTAVDYLVKANINPEPMADFMFELAQNHSVTNGFSWISTHPESEERAKYILEYSKGKKYLKTQTVNATTWKLFQDRIKKKE